MSHVIDDLEMYAVGALPAERSETIAAHLRECPPCRAAAAELVEVVTSLADAVPPREPPPGLKVRILAAAGAEPRLVLPPFRLPRVGVDLRLVTVAAAAVLLLGVDTSQTIRLQALQADRDAYEAIATDVAHGGRTWYMAGVDQWKGMGGNLMQPASGQPAFVLFHDLRPLPQGQLYALWLIAPDGKWVRGTSFRPAAERIQMVQLGQELSGFERCAVTVEPSATGKREGPIVMQSRIAAPAP